MLNSFLITSALKNVKLEVLQLLWANRKDKDAYDELQRRNLNFKCNLLAPCTWDPIRSLCRFSTWDVVLTSAHRQLLLLSTLDGMALQLPSQETKQTTLLYTDPQTNLVSAAHHF